MSRSAVWSGGERAAANEAWPTGGHDTHDGGRSGLASAVRCSYPNDFVRGWEAPEAGLRPACRRLSRVKGDACFLSWADLHTFGADAVTVSDARRLRPAADDAEERAASNELQVIGKLVLTQSGTALGKSEDVEVDPESGTVVALDLGEAGTVAGDRIIGIGSYALVVSDAPPA